MRPSQTSARGERAIRNQVDVGLRRYLVNIYTYMALGLGLTGLTALAIGFAPPAVQAFFFSLRWIAMFSTVGLALFFGSRRIQEVRISTAQGLFWVYALLMGVWLSGLFSIYHTTSIAQAFFATALTFGSVSAYGMLTNRDLTSIGSFCMMGLFGLVAISLVSVVLGFFGIHFSSALGWGLSLVSLVIFVGLTAYETQSLKEMYFHLPHDGPMRERVAILGALSLYMNVINIFLAILRLFNDNK